MKFKRPIEDQLATGRRRTWFSACMTYRLEQHFERLGNEPDIFYVLKATDNERCPWAIVTTKRKRKTAIKLIEELAREANGTNKQRRNRRNVDARANSATRLGLRSDHIDVAERSGTGVSSKRAADVHGESGQSSVKHRLVSKKSKGTGRQRTRPDDEAEPADNSAKGQQRSKRGSAATTASATLHEDKKVVKRKQSTTRRKKLAN